MGMGLVGGMGGYKVWFGGWVLTGSSTELLFRLVTPGFEVPGRRGEFSPEVSVAATTVGLARTCPLDWRRMYRCLGGGVVRA